MPISIQEILDPFLPDLLFSFAVCVILYLFAPLVLSLAQRKLGSLFRWLELLRHALQQHRWVDRLFLVTAGAALVGFVAQDLHNYDAFGSFSDLRYYDSVLYGAVTGGDIFINPYRFNLILIALVPVYAVLGGLKGILAVQSLGLAVTAFPLYWYARRQIGRWLAYTLTLTFLVFPAVALLNGATFYEIKLAVPLLAFALFFLLRRRYLPFMVCLGLALIVKQEVSFLALGFAAFLFFVQRKRLLGFSIAAIGVGLAVFIIEYLFPTVIGKPYPMFEERYAYLGRTLSEVVTSLVLRPGLALEHMLIPSKLNLMLHLFVPLALLPLLGFEVTAIALPSFVYILLSDFLPHFNPLVSYWQSPLIPFLFFGAIVGLKRLLGYPSLRELARRKLALMGLLVAIAGLYVPRTWTRILDPAMFVANPRDVLGHQLIGQIPSGATVIAQMELFMPVFATHRFNAYEYSAQCNYVIADPNCGLGPADYMFADTKRNWYDFGKEGWEHWLASGYFEPVSEQDGYLLLRRKTSIDTQRQFDSGWAILGYTPTPSKYTRSLGWRFGHTLTLLGYAPVPSLQVRGGETLRLIGEWEAGTEPGEDYSILVRLVDAQGHVWAQDNRTTLEGLIPLQGWKAGDIYRDQYNLKLPQTIPPGKFRLQVGLWDSRAGRNVEAIDSEGRSLGTEPVVGSITVEKDTSDIPARYLPIERPLQVDMQGIRLIGTAEIPRAIGRGEGFSVGLYWRPRDKPRGDYAVSVQLRDVSGAIVAEQTGRPAAGAYPTTRWQKGEVLLDWHDLSIPATLPEGDYTLVVALRDAAGHMVLGEANVGSVSISR